MLAFRLQHALFYPQRVPIGYHRNLKAVQRWALTHLECHPLHSKILSSVIQQILQSKHRIQFRLLSLPIIIYHSFFRSWDIGRFLLFSLCKWSKSFLINIVRWSLCFYRFNWRIAFVRFKSNVQSFIMSTGVTPSSAAVCSFSDTLTSTFAALIVSQEHQIREQYLLDQHEQAQEHQTHEQKLLDQHHHVRDSIYSICIITVPSSTSIVKYNRSRHRSTRPVNKSFLITTITIER